MSKEKEEVFDNVEIFNGAPKDQTAAELLSSGKAITQIKTEYHTAIAVQKPRNLDLIVNELDKEAQYGGKDFFYAWPVKDKKTGKKKIVEGCSIGAGMAIARAFGNCAVPVDVQETPNAFVFTASFVDIEKGFTISRVYRHKKKPVVGRYDADRWEDMEFQKGQSKALRNVVLAGVPKWLSSRVLRKAKQAVIDGIGKEGLDVARDKAVVFLAGYGIAKERIEVAIDSKYSEWTAETVAQLRSMCNEIHTGEANAESLFPSIEEMGGEDPAEKNNIRTGGQDKKEKDGAVDPHKSYADFKKEVDAIADDKEMLLNYTSDNREALLSTLSSRSVSRLSNYITELIKELPGEEKTDDKDTGQIDELTGEASDKTEVQMGGSVAKWYFNPSLSTTFKHHRDLVLKCADTDELNAWGQQYGKSIASALSETELPLWDKFMVERVNKLVGI
jgi:hypothetical protein